MQVQKEEVRIRIQNAAIDVFSEKGYQKASMQTIAKRASISVSNIYNYFDSKGRLFESLVKPVADEITWKLKLTMEEEEKNEAFDYFLQPLMVLLGQLLKEKHREIVLLFGESVNNDYSSYKQDLIRLIEKHLIEDIGDDAMVEELSLTFYMIVKNVVEGIVEIARRYESDEKAYKAVHHLMQYHASGMKNFYQ